jgi:hypothetical protein
MDLKMKDTMIILTRATTLCLLLICTSLPTIAADRVSDEFLAGYMASILERDMGWKRDSFILKIVDGVATITLFQEDQTRREEANDARDSYSSSLWGSSCKMREFVDSSSSRNRNAASDTNLLPTDATTTHHKNRSPPLRQGRHKRSSQGALSTQVGQ